MTNPTSKEKLRDAWRLFYGEAPEGTVKYNRSEEILKFWLSKIQEDSVVKDSLITAIKKSEVAPQR